MYVNASWRNYAYSGVKKWTLFDNGVFTQLLDGTKLSVKNVSCNIFSVGSNIHIGVWNGYYPNEYALSTVAIDVTGYKYFKFTVTSPTFGNYGDKKVGVSSSGSDFSKYYVLGSVMNNQLCVLDISSLTGSYYIKFFVSQNNYTKDYEYYIYKMWLE